MNRTRDSHTKWSKPERERQIPYDITYMWSLKYDANDLSTKQKPIMDHGGQNYVCQGRGGETGIDGEFGVSRCWLLHLEWMGDGVLLYSTGNCAQSLGLEHNRKWKKNKKVLSNVCIWAVGSLYYTAEIEGTLQINYNFKKNLITSLRMSRS